MKNAFQTICEITFWALLSSSLVAVSEETNHYALGLRAEFEGKSSEAIEEYILSAEQGSSEAKYALGRLHRDFLGDESGSLAWFLKAANEGNSYAQYEMGKLCLLSDAICGVSPEEQAKYWFSLSVHSGNNRDAAYSLFELSVAEEEKLRWLRLSADQGLVQGIRRLSDAYRTGEFGLAIEMDLAQYWFNQAQMAQE